LYIGYLTDPKMSDGNSTVYRKVEKIQRIATVGAGSVGRGWSALYLAKGYEVVATDPSPRFEQGLHDFVKDSWDSLRRLHGGAEATPPLDRLSFVSSPSKAAERADLIQENAPENLDIKKRLLQELDEATPPDCIILSSTGGIGPSLLQADCRYPGRIVVAHPFNPPHIMPLVEIVGGKLTKTEAVDWTRRFMRGLGKRPIVVRREVAGHLANRFQAALLREAFHCLVEEIASAQDIDDAIRYGLGLRWALMGGLMTFHLAGGRGGAAHTLDLAADAYESWWADLGDIHLTPEVRATIIACTTQLADGRSIEEWIRLRDESLVKLIIETTGSRMNL
jgi:carnitine 3-dehydrogenase